MVSYLPGLHVLVSRVGAAGGVLSGNKPVASDQSPIFSSDLGINVLSTFHLLPLLPLPLQIINISFPMVSNDFLSFGSGEQLEGTVPSGPQEPNMLLLLRGGDGGCGRHQEASRRLPLTTPEPGGEGEESVLSHYIGGLLVSLKCL